MGILDVVNGHDDIVHFLDTQQNLGDDLLALKRAAEVWKTDQPIDIGESGTLYRLLKFASWKLGLNKKFILHGTLRDRQITDDPSIVNLSQKELHLLDNGTSQWASAAALLGDRERLPDASFKLRLTYEAIDHWHTQRSAGKTWIPRYDETILGQAEAFVRMMKKGKVDFIPQQAEDFCFAYTFGLVSLAEAEQKWPSLRGHESDRILEMKEVLECAKAGTQITSKDHRVVQAIAMWGKVYAQHVEIAYPASVNKSWPQFWDFLKAYS